MTESKPMTLDDRAKMHVWDAQDIGEDPSNNSFKTGWKECFSWVLSEVEKHYGESTLIHTKEFMLKLKEKHEKEIGE